MQVGIYPGIDQGAYRAAPGVSTSFLKAFADSPRKARYGVQQTRPALERGTLVHTAILEPHLLERTYQPTDLVRSGTQAWETEERLATGRKLVKRHEYEAALRMRDAVHADYEAAELLAGVHVEQSFWWTDEHTGLLRKGRTDAVNPAFRVLMDIKTTTDSSASAFRSTASNFLYHWQEASYTEGWARAGGWEPQGFVFIAVEIEFPYLVGKYRIDPEDIQTARDDMRAIMPAVKRCLDTDTWPTNRDGVVMLDRLPRSAHLTDKDLGGLFR